MALTDILTKIAEDADKEATVITTEAEEKVREIEAEATEAVTAFEEEARVLRERASQKASEQVLAGARHHASFTQAEFRNKQIQNVFDEVEKKLTNLPPADYASLMKTLLKEAPQKATFMVAAERENETKKILKELELNDSVTVAPKGELLGGCIAVSDDSEFDFSFKGMLENLEKTQRSYAAQELFN